MGDIALTKFLTLKNPMYEFDRGKNLAVPIGLTINTRAYTIDQVWRCGIQGLLDKDTTDCPKAHGASAVTDTNIRYQHGQQWLNRHQLSSNLELASGSDAAKKTITLGIKGFAWRSRAGDDTSPLDPRYTSEFTITAALPVGKGITIGPYVRYLLVKTVSAGTFMSDRYGFTLAFSFIGKGGPGRTIY